MQLSQHYHLIIQKIIFKLFKNLKFSFRFKEMDSLANGLSSIDLPNESQLTEEFQLLTKRMNKILNQTEFNINNGEYIYKEHCNELRRQVQLAKETQILKIEEITDNLMNEIDKFEKESLEAVSKVNKEQLVNKLN